ncbi:hypothetical protein K493DRAFT_333294 [Basidiobolus meristosporus CBS 931.73]|uniref:Conserved oligomeric Golgi complex subunit 1 n=1 Tax=Basidiobolus meristosporus CBS 931.73 TaxID=1314790 RepID=A0A1Y1Z8E9_9FUNG|nr:hypothetical protein K493DRAFT_333294 [Basidiobolus meristosporus CBS 931.73]|eukprot:ORY06095.1 hypothetical protein K493DRAFT_333294 [Basidiobolus meristosporus CBS 931.73]
MVELEEGKKVNLEPMVKELFVKHTIPELRALLKRTRYDIEGKRHELRTVVGESYNSLLEAADSIICMRTVGLELSDSIKCIEKYSNLEYLKKESTNIHKSSPQETENQKQQLYSTAAQIKLLVDIPEQIWHGLETSKFLSASLLYLIACLVYESLQKGGDIENINVETIFPVVQKQWNAINYFKSKITRRANTYIQRSDIGEKDVAETLLALLLLDNSLTVDNLFQSLLNTRKEAINEVFRQQPSSDQDVQDRLLDVLTIVKETVFQATSIFFDDQNSEKKPLLCSYIQHLADGHSFQESGSPLPTKENSTLSSLVKAKPNMHILIRHLPSSLQSYRPTLNPTDYELNSSTLQTTLKQWLDEVINICAEKSESLLVDFVTSVKSAERIRREIWDTIGKEKAPETNIGKFVWESIQFDMHQNEIGLKNMIHQSLHTYTPVVNRVKSAFEYILNELHEDLCDTISWASKSEADQFCQASDAIKLSEHFDRSLIEALVKYREGMANLLTNFLESTSGTKSGKSNTVQLDNSMGTNKWMSSEAADQCLVIGRVSRTIALSFKEYIQSLPQEFFATEEHRTQLNEEALKLGQDVYKRAYAPWIDCVTQSVEEIVKSKLTLPGWIDSIEQRHCWEVVQPSSDSPSIPQAQALVPTHVSSWVVEILFDMTKELTRVGNFITDKSMTQTLMVELAQIFFNSFTGYFKSDAQLPDSIKLQLLLDMYYLNHVFTDSLEERHQSDDSGAQNVANQALDQVESMFDPDLSASVKLALKANADQYFEQTALLLSSLPFTKAAKPQSPTNRRGSIGSGDYQYHHILSINSPASRFTLLPIGQKLGRVNKPRV